MTVAAIGEASLRARIAGAATTAWHRVTPGGIVLVAAACLVWSALELAAVGIPQLPRALVSGPGLNSLLSMQLNGLAVFFLVMVADAMDDDARGRWLPYAVAVVGGVAAGSSLTWLVSQSLLGLATAYAGHDGHEPFATYVYRHGVGRLALLGLATYVHAWRRQAVRSLGALRAHQLDQAEVERRLLASRLAVMQARVDPEAVLARLAQVEALYPADPAAADAMLKALAADLRASIPRADE